MPSFSCAELLNEFDPIKFSITEVLQRDNSSYTATYNNPIHITRTDDFPGQWFIATTMVPDSFYPEIIAIKRNKTNYPYGDYDLLNVKLMPSAALEEAAGAARASS